MLLKQLQGARHSGSPWWPAKRAKCRRLFSVDCADSVSTSERDNNLASLDSSEEGKRYGTAAHERVLRLLESSPSARGLNIQVVGAADGQVTLGFEVAANMINADGICQGGYLFTLGDTAAAFACLTRHPRAATQSAQVTYVAPARLGERLLAEAVEVVHVKRSAIYDVRITGANRQVLALFRGHFRLFDAAAGMQKTDQ